MKKETKAKTSTTKGITIFGIISGTLVGIAFGPFAGLLAATVGIGVGVPIAKREAKEKADKLMNDDVLFEKAQEINLKKGFKEISFKQELKNQNKEIPFLGRVIYGDKEIFEKKYYFDDEV